jgi:hypothetical protein
VRQDLLCQGQDLFSKFGGHDDVPISVNAFHPKHWSKFLKCPVVGTPQLVKTTVGQIWVGLICKYVFEQISGFLPVGDSTAFDFRGRRQGWAIISQAQVS